MEIYTISTEIHNGELHSISLAIKLDHVVKLPAMNVHNIIAQAIHGACKSHGQPHKFFDILHQVKNRISFPIEDKFHTITAQLLPNLKITVESLSLFDQRLNFTVSSN